MLGCALRSGNELSRLERDQLWTGIWPRLLLRICSPEACSKRAKSADRSHMHALAPASLVQAGHIQPDQVPHSPLLPAALQLIQTTRH